jgi:hypothetical protein
MAGRKASEKHRAETYHLWALTEGQGGTMPEGIAILILFLLGVLTGAFVTVANPTIHDKLAAIRERFRRH